VDISKLATPQSAVKLERLF